MNKLFKIGYIALCSVLAMNFTACTEEVDYTPAEQSAVAETQVYFLASNSAAPVMGKDDTQFSVIVGRANGSSAQSVPLIVTNPNNDVFTVPATVEFAAGETEKELVIQTSDKMLLNEKYYLKLEIPEEFVNPYIEQENHPILIMNVLKEDYELYGTGTYTCNFFGGSWPQDLEYSPALDKYRFPNLYEEGYNYVFSWDGKNIKAAASKVESGYVHPSYGMCSITTEATAYREAQNAFLFQFKWTIPDGRTFGSFVSQFVLEEVK